MAKLTIVPEAVDQYLTGFLSKRHPVFKQMERMAESIRYPIGNGRSIPFPIIGPLVGCQLAHYAKIIKAKRVFELGSGYGYSAFWFAQAVGPGGKVVCTDTRPENRETARQCFSRAGLWSRVDFRLGDGVQILRRERNSSYDIIFIDMDKERYPLGFKTAVPKLQSGGLLIADNVLWSSKVLRQSRDPITRGLQQFTRLITHSPRFATVIHPIRDGVSVSLKLR